MQARMEVAIEGGAVSACECLQVFVSAAYRSSPHEVSSRQWLHNNIHHVLCNARNSKEKEEGEKERKRRGKKRGGKRGREKRRKEGGKGALKP